MKIDGFNIHDSVHPIKQFQENSMSAQSISQQIAHEWEALVNITPKPLRDAIFDLLIANTGELMVRYKKYMDDDHGIKEVIPSDAERAKFSNLFKAWVTQLFDPKLTDIPNFVESQSAIGEMMARIGYPPHAIAKSMRKLQSWFILVILQQNWDEAERIKAGIYIVNLIGLSLELRSASYFVGISHQSKVDEAYRFAAIGANIAMERERQRAFLMEWERNILMWFYNSPNHELPRLGYSEFGLWLNHKASIIFEKSPKLDAVMGCVNRIDNELLPPLEAVLYDDRETIVTKIQEIEIELSKIKFEITEVFESYLELENGKDSLTRLLNRRFLPTVLSREITLQKRLDTDGFGVLLLDLDYFKKINDTFGHPGGDIVLQQIASIVTNTVRNSDFTFRYGGEEILVVLVEVTLNTMMY